MCKPRTQIIVLCNLLLGLFSTTTVAGTLSCPASQHLVSVERDGRVTQGSLEKLRQAYRQGARLRVGWEFDFAGDDEPEISHWADAGFISEFQGVISAQVGDIERQAPRMDEGRIDFNGTAQRWSGLISSDGSLLGRFSDGEPSRHSVASIWCLVEPPSVCEQRWRLVYRNDADGNPVAGEKTHLTDALRHGRSLRMAWGFRRSESPDLAVEHVAEPVFVTATAGEVSAQVPEHIGQQAYLGAGSDTYEDPAVMWRGLLSTNGRFDAAWVHRGTGETLRRLPQRAAVSWYAFGPAPSCEYNDPVDLAIPDGVRRVSK